MRFIELQISATAGLPPLSATFEPGYNPIKLGSTAAVVVPVCLQSLLYPTSVGADVLGLLQGAGAEPSWRLVAEIAGRKVRISRRIGQESVRLELGDGQGGWELAGEGAEGVERKLSRARPPVSASFFAAVDLGAGLRAAAMPSTAAARAPGDVDLLGTEDYFGNDDRAPGIAMSPEAVAELRLEFRERRRVEGLRAAVDARRKAVEAASEALGALADRTGELGAIERELSSIPNPRVLAQEERDALQSPESRAAGYEQRISQLHDELEAAEKTLSAVGAPRIWADPVFVGGVVLTIAATVWSIAGGRSARPIAIGNLLFAGLALASGLRHIGVSEKRSAARRRVEGVRRRIEQLGEEKEAWEVRLKELRAELGVRDLDGYQGLQRRRKDLEDRVAGLRSRNAMATQTPEYQRAERQRDGLREAWEEARRLSESVDEPRGPSQDIAEALRRAGVNPSCALWVESDGARAWAQLAACVASLGGLAPDAATFWQKSVDRLLGEQAEPVGLGGSGELLLRGRVARISEVSPEVLAVVIEALRLALVTWGLQERPTELRPLVRVQPYTAMAAQSGVLFERILRNVGEKTQVIVFAWDV